MGLSVCVCVLANAFVSVCACGSAQRLIHNDDRKYSIISSHSVIFTKQQQGGERERKGLGKRWKRGDRLKEMKVEGDKDRQGWKEDDEAQMRERRRAC